MFKKSQLILRYGVIIGLIIIVLGLLLGLRIVCYFGAAIVALTPITSMALIAYDLKTQGDGRGALLAVLIIAIITFSVVVSGLGP